MKALRRFFLRRLYAHRIARYSAEVARLEDLRVKLVPALDHALRELGCARSDLVFLDIYRAPITHAPGQPKRDGVVRRISGKVSEPDDLERAIWDRR